MPGEKDIERAVGKHQIEPGKLRQGGYVKLDYLRNLPAPTHSLFNNERRTIIYNPHFDPAISSWPVARKVIDTILADDRYNLIVAPHIRIAENMSADERADCDANWSADCAGRCTSDCSPGQPAGNCARETRTC